MNFQNILNQCSLNQMIIIHMIPGLGFCRPKPVFAVQNGINWDKPVFPVQNWEKLSQTGKNYILSSKMFLKCDYQTKIEQDRLEDNLTKKVMSS